MTGESGADAAQSLDSMTIGANQSVLNRARDDLQIRECQWRQPSSDGANGRTCAGPQSHEASSFDEHGDELRECLKRLVGTYAENCKRDGPGAAESQGSLVYLVTSTLSNWPGAF